ncbi:MAG TPA: glycosyltransferase [Longimicrobiales bacterium]|nr:glycosyltransferase [Longimicrobiales bacterium]
MLEILFWACCALVFWTYIGYPVVMLVRGRHAPLERHSPHGEMPKVTAVLAVRNAATLLPDRLENLLTQDHPAELLDVVVVLNGCTDESRAVAEAFARPSAGRVRVLESPAGEGKAGALNLGVRSADGDVVVFADARQQFAGDVVRRLSAVAVQHGVGAVSGRLEIAAGEAAAAEGMRRYWSLETRLRLAESRTGSVMGVTGAVYAVRRDAFVPIPPGTILDDVYLPLQIALAGRRVLLEPRAIAYDRATPSQGSEYRRRVRTLLGNLQLVRLDPRLVRPWRNPVFVRFVSHKLLRVFTPLFLIGILVSGLLLDGALYRTVAFAEVAVLLLGAIGLAFGIRPLAVPAALLMIQIAALDALFRPRRTAGQVWHDGTPPVASSAKEPWRH